jgi:succinyl-diaminopimelate desuccinylase
VSIVEQVSLGSGAADAAASRKRLLDRVVASADDVIALAQSLIRVPSENPDGDTRKIADFALGILRAIDGTEVDLVVGREPFVNVIARVKGAGPGRRVVLNGHLDTFPVGDRSLWTVDPLGGAVIDGRLYGRGAADMKAGIAASMSAFRLLADMRHAWAGELVLTLAADEETMGRWGSAYLLEAVPHATGDALICGDAGSPKVIRFGEKGMLWLELTAKGRSSHGAHVHLGRNALDLLVRATQQVQSLAKLPVDTPAQVAQAIARARSVSEPLAGAGETDVLTAITVNLGYLQGGTSLNLVPAQAKAALDIRLPVGTSVDAMMQRINEMLAPLEGVEARVLVRHEPTYSDPEGGLFKLLVKNGTEAIGTAPVVNMRVGASDTRIFRSHGIPSAVYGCTPHNMGGPNEYATVDDVQTVFRVHALTAFDFLLSS